MIWQFLWFALAGFVLGFTASTLWEWYFYRRERIRLIDEQLAALNRERAQNDRARTVARRTPPDLPAVDDPDTGTFVHAEPPEPPVATSSNFAAESAFASDTPEAETQPESTVDLDEIETEDDLTWVRPVHPVPDAEDDASMAAVTDRTAPMEEDGRRRDVAAEAGADMVEEWEGDASVDPALESDRTVRVVIRPADAADDARDRWRNEEIDDTEVHSARVRIAPFSEADAVPVARASVQDVSAAVRTEEELPEDEFADASLAQADGVTIAPATKDDDPGEISAHGAPDKLTERHEEPAGQQGRAGQEASASAWVEAATPATGLSDVAHWESVPEEGDPADVERSTDLQPGPAADLFVTEPSPAADPERFPESMRSAFLVGLEGDERGPLPTGQETQTPAVDEPAAVAARAGGLEEQAADRTDRAGDDLDTDEPPEAVPAVDTGNLDYRETEDEAIDPGDIDPGDDVLDWGESAAGEETTVLTVDHIAGAMDEGAAVGAGHRAELGRLAAQIRAGTVAGTPPSELEAEPAEQADSPQEGGKKQLVASAARATSPAPLTAAQHGEESTAAGGTESAPYPDNLSQIKGIGQIYCGRLYAAGIFTWHQLANTPVAELWRIVDPPVSANIDDWPVQAEKLAAKHGRVGATYVGPVPDDLSRIRGIGRVGKSSLYAAGIYTFRDLAAALPEQLAEIIPSSPNGEEIDYARWLKEARSLADIGDDA